MSTSKTFPLPPVADLAVMPQDMFTVDEMALLRRFLSATLRTKGKEEYEKALTSWTDEGRSAVANMLSLLRSKGFYPERVETGGQIVWGIMLKSKLQMAMERNDGEQSYQPDMRKLAEKMRERFSNANQG